MRQKKILELWRSKLTKYQSGKYINTNTGYVKEVIKNRKVINRTGGVGIKIPNRK